MCLCAVGGWMGEGEGDTGTDPSAVHQWAPSRLQPQQAPAFGRAWGAQGRLGGAGVRPVHSEQWQWLWHCSNHRDQRPY